MRRFEFRFPSLKFVVALVIVSVVVVLATSQLKETFIDNSYLSTAAVAASGAALLVMVGYGLGLQTGESVLVSVVAFVAVGIPVVGGAATLDASSTFFSSLTSSWAELLSSTPPIEMAPELRIVPFALVWLGVLVGGEVLRSSRLRPVFAAAGPFVTAASVALVADGNRRSGFIVGLAVAFVVLLLATPYFRAQDDDQLPASGRRVLDAGALAIVGALGAGALIFASILPGTQTKDRFDLRDRRPPVFEPLLQPSPLSELKASLQPDTAGTVAFTVSSSDRPTRFRVAALTDFDGVVWNVAPTDGGAANFRPIGSRFPRLDSEVFGSENRSEVIAAVINLASVGEPGTGNVYLPNPGRPLEIEFGSSADMRLNVGTGTIALPEGLTPGLSYTSRSRIQLEIPVDDFAAATFVSRDREVSAEELPASILNLHAELVGEDRAGYDVIEAIQESLAFTGSYSAAIDTAPGHSVDRIVRFLTEETPTVGFEEQYAATAALLLDLSQIESRIVVGYRIPEERYVDLTAEVLAGDMTAWVEVLTVEFGWVPVDVTPDRSRIPIQEQLAIDVQDVAVPNAPPPIPPADLPDRVEAAAEEEQLDEEEVEDEDIDPDTAVSGGVSTATIVGVAASLPLVLALLAAGLIVIAKRRRTSRRRSTSDPGASIAGAWVDLRERFAEAGARPDASDTPLVAAKHFVGQLDADNTLDAELAGLVKAVERAAYHRDDPEPALAESAWIHRDSAVGVLKGSKTRTDRFKMSVDPRPLIAKRHGK